MLKVCSILLSFSLFCFSAFAESTDLETLKKYLVKPAPKWVKKRIAKDLEFYRHKQYNLEELNEKFYQDEGTLLVKFTILNNEVYVEENLPEPLQGHRSPPITQALKELCSIVPMPDLTFFATMHDGLYPGNMLPYGFPLFVMSKNELEGPPGILFPDFEALARKYQVIPNQPVENYSISWKKKKNQLVWRGSTAQYPGNMDFSNFTQFSRVTLCQLSMQYPTLIDAKFTMYFLGADQINELQQLGGNWIPFPEQFQYKYQIIIDGLAASFSNSGWKYFSHSVIFQPESPWIQWYSDELIPYHNYIPLKADLSDLLFKLNELKKNDNQAKELAKNSLRFAKNHLLYVNHLVYLYELLKQYSLVIKSTPEGTDYPPLPLLIREPSKCHDSSLFIQTSLSTLFLEKFRHISVLIGP